MMRKVPEKRTSIRMRRSRVADGECLQLVGFEKDGDDFPALMAELDGGIAARERKWRMLDREKERECDFHKFRTTWFFNFFFFGLISGAAHVSQLTGKYFWQLYFIIFRLFNHIFLLVYRNRKSVERNKCK